MTFQYLTVRVVVVTALECYMGSIPKARYLILIRSLPSRNVLYFLPRKISLLRLKIETALLRYRGVSLSLST